MYDLARDLGLSRTTVSYALSPKWQSYRIPAKTRQRVLDLVEKVGFRPNRLAVSLRTRKTKTVGVMVSNIGYDQHDFLVGIDEGLTEDYTALIGFSQYSAEKEIRILNSFEERMVDGLIVVATDSARTRDLLSEISARGTPIVECDHSFGHLSTGVVEPDQLEMTRIAVRHLIDLGHTRIAFIRPGRIHAGTRDRLAGYEQTMKQAGLATHFFPEHESGLVGENYFEEQMKAAIQTLPLPFAIFTHGYPQGLRTVLAAGLRCPEDVSIVTPATTVSDPYRGILKVQPTKVSWSIKSMGQHAAQLLLEAFHSSGTTWQRHIKLPIVFEKGESTAALQ